VKQSWGWRLGSNVPASSLLVDARSAVLHANQVAGALVRAGDGLTAPGNTLACEHGSDTSRLRQLVNTASGNGSGGTLAVRRHADRRPLSVLVGPLRGQHPGLLAPPATAILLVADPERAVAASCPHLCQLYGLTAAEARTAHALLDYDRLADVAGRLGVSLATVRTLLQRTFEKTGTHRQAELVGLLLAHRLPAPTAVA
jgi:DNA-binding CsgD family transcriptional regulator